LTQEELQVPYEVKPYPRDAEDRASKELKGVHFVDASPVMTDGDFVLAESGAIVGESKRRKFISGVVDLLNPTEYLMGRYGQGRGQLFEAARIDDSYCNVFILHGGFADDIWF
jgi:glutathione S-transferase